MVLERIAAKLLNKYLGQYIENFDRTKIKIGIMKECVEFEDLDINLSALIHDKLDLPLRIRVRCIEKLKLTIPWKSLFSQPVVALVDGIYVLAVPDVPTMYNAEKDEKDKQDKKQRTLLKIEKGKKSAAKIEDKKTSFSDKVIDWVIENVQFQVHNVHVRFEDANTWHPLSIGVSIAEVSFQITDENWMQRKIKKKGTQICKVLKLDSLAVYCNIDSRQYNSLFELPGRCMLKTLREAIARKEKNLDHQFLIKPLSFEGYINLNGNPELNDFSIPKIFLTHVLEKIEIEMSKLQYNNILEMMVAFEKLYLRRVYSKYRPKVPLNGNANVWWQYAMDSVLEKTRRIRRTFTLEHRTTMEKYRDAYARKLYNPKRVPRDVQRTITECENYLDVTSIALMRSHAEAKVATPTPKRTRSRSRHRLASQSGINSDMEREQGENKEQENEVLNDEEKSIVYEIIGYKENNVEPAYPGDFVAVELRVEVKKIIVILTDESEKSNILTLRLDDVFACVKQKPAERVIQVEGRIDHLNVEGCRQGVIARNIAEPQNIEGDVKYPFLYIFLERTPLDPRCDTRVVVKSRPLQIVYDKTFIRNTIAFFKPPKDVASMKQLLKAAKVWLKDIKDMLTTKLKNAMKQSKYKDVSIDLMPSCIIFPFGEENNTGPMIKVVVDLGNLKMHTVVQEKTLKVPNSQAEPPPDVNHAGLSTNTSMESMCQICGQKGCPYMLSKNNYDGMSANAYMESMCQTCGKKECQHMLSGNDEDVMSVNASMESMCPTCGRKGCQYVSRMRNPVAYL